MRKRNESEYVKEDGLVVLTSLLKNGELDWMMFS